MRFAPLPADPESLARLWNRGYEGYFTPIDFTPEQMEAHLTSADIALAGSVGLYDGAEPVGFSLLGVRGVEGWVGGFGVVPEYRRRGLAAGLIAEQVEHARRAGVRRLRLEVMVQNWALKVYAAAGFRVLRRLSVLAGRPPATAAPSARLAAPAEVLPALSRLAGEHPPVWQREPASWSGKGGPAPRVILAGPPAEPSGYAVFTEPSGGRVRIVDAGARDEASASEVMKGIAALHPEATLGIVNEPEGSPIHRALLGMGFREVAAQYEMVLDLASHDPPASDGPDGSSPNRER